MSSQSLSDLLQLATDLLSAHTDSARLDAEILLCKVLKKPREYLYTWPEKETSLQQQTDYQSLIERRIAGVPLAYLTGEKEFWSHTFKVTPDTLIPRPDTELIVELSIAKLKVTGGPFLDLGTGSGAIAISVAKELPDIEVVASDNSDAALAVANANASRLNANVNFLQSNWFENIPAQLFSVIATNPPYIADNDPHLQRGGLQYEPLHALRSCENGFADITAIINKAPDYMSVGSWLLIEHGNTQGKRTAELMQNRQITQVETLKDLAQNDRVTLGQKA